MKNVLPDILRKSVCFVRTHRPEICTVVSVTGVVVTSVLSVRSGIKAEKILLNACMEDEPKKETAKKLIPVFVPTAIAVATTIGCVLYSDISNRKMQTALTAAYATSVKALQDYKKQVVTVCGEEQAEQIDRNIEKEHYISQLAETDLKSGHSTADEMLFYDSESKRYFWKTMEEVLIAEYELNRLFAGLGIVSLNDWYHILEIDDIDYGDAVGWEAYIGEINYGYKWIDFTHKTVESDDPDIPPYCVISFDFPPHSDYMGDGVN